MFDILYREDTIFGDITSELVIPEDMECVGKVIARENCIVAGIKYLSSKLEKLGLDVEILAKDGDRVSKNTVVMSIKGNARTILSVERALLNILGRMSGIATRTHEIVEKVRRINPKIRIAATRKTLWGYLDKVAVQIGGGDTHRWNLGDMVMIKDNHIALVGIEEAIKRAKRVSFSKKVEVEADNENDALKAAELGADIILLDNMSPDEIGRIAKKLRNYRVIIEISGGITPQNIEEYARCDVDVISMGYLTHSVDSVDFSMEIEKMP